jgi:hypothetical protein
LIKIYKEKDTDSFKFFDVDDKFTNFLTANKSLLKLKEVKEAAEV